MKKIINILLAAAVLAGLAWAAKGPSAAPKDNYVPGMLIVQLKPELRGSFQPVAKNSGRASFGVPSIDGLCARYRVSRIEPLFYDPNISKNEKTVKHGLDLMYVLYLPLATDIMKAVNEFSKSEAVDGAMPNVIKKYTATPNDPRYSQQWHLTKVQAAAAWDISQGDTTVLLSIVDSGCDWTHEDLNGNMWVNPAEDINHNGQFDNTPAGSGGDLDGLDQDGNGLVDDVVGYDFTDGDPDPYPTGDPSDHGTHCNGIAGAVTNNATGVAGLGWNCRRLGFRCTSGGGIGIYEAFNAIYYSIEARASVISMSWGSYGYWVPERRVMDYAHDNGVVLVAAAGNDDIMDAHFPSALPNIVSVAATNQSDQKSGASGANSNYGTWIDVCSPGDLIWSTVPNNGYEAWYGTSMATPLVAGLVGLIRAQHPDWSNATIETHIQKTCDNIDAQNPSYIGLLGAGRINAYKALNTAAHPELAAMDYSVDDPVKGNGNGKVDAGEDAALTVFVRNRWGDAYDVQGTLISNDPFVTVTSGTSYYGSLEHAILGGHTRGNSTPYQISVATDAPNHVASMSLHLTATGYDTTVSFRMPIGRSGILLLKHDDRSRLIWSFYRDAFAALGVDYEFWDWADQKTPPLAKMRKFGTVFAYTEWSFPNLDSTDIDTLKAYLTQGGSFYIGGQDFGWDITESSAVPDCYDPDFYLNWMKAAWGDDNSGGTSVTGIAGDPIGDGLSFNWDQPYLDPSYEYPDYFNAASGAVDFLQYNTGQNCGLHYAGPYRLVYTGFSPEAIVGDDNRQEFINRVLRWLSGDIRLTHTPLPDNEDSLAANTVEAVIMAENTLNASRSAMYWMRKSEGIYHRVPFTVSNDTFRADIPAPGHPDSIFYFVYAEDNYGYSGILPAGAPGQAYSFYAGPDPIPPAFTVTALPDTMELIGPYPVTVRVTDNLGVDTSSVKVHYYRYDQYGVPEADSASMAYQSGNEYAAEIGFPSWSKLNQRIYYFFTARDIASTPNTGTSGLMSFNLKDSLWFETFPDSLINTTVWDTGLGWYSWTGAGNLTYFARSQRTTNYPSNFNNPLTYLVPRDLRPYTGMRLYLKQRRYLAAGDTCFIEATRDDGSSWTAVRTFTGNQTSWVVDTLTDLGAYCGTGSDNDSVRVRFRLQTDASATNSVGWYIDDFRLKATGPYYVGVEGGPQAGALPKAVALQPAYPNPAKGAATISFQLPTRQKVRLEVYNIVGQRIVTLADRELEAGYHKLAWNGRDEQGKQVSNGIYFYKLEAGQSRLTNKLVILR